MPIMWAPIHKNVVNNRTEMPTLIETSMAIDHQNQSTPNEMTNGMTKRNLGTHIK